MQGAKAAFLNYVEHEGLAKLTIQILALTCVGCLAYTWGYAEVRARAERGRAACAALAVHCRAARPQRRRCVGGLPPQRCGSTQSARLTGQAPLSRHPMRRASTMRTWCCRRRMS